MAILSVFFSIFDHSDSMKALLGFAWFSLAWFAVAYSFWQLSVLKECLGIFCPSVSTIS